jgi:hypothetical protein
VPSSALVVVNNFIYDGLQYSSRIYELTNHLDNVLVTVSAKKLQHDAGNGELDYYTADVLSVTD